VDVLPLGAAAGPAGAGTTGGVPEVPLVAGPAAGAGATDGGGTVGDALPAGGADVEDGGVPEVPLVAGPAAGAGATDGGGTVGDALPAGAALAGVAGGAVLGGRRTTPVLTRAPDGGVGTLGGSGMLASLGWRGVKNCERNSGKPRSGPLPSPRHEEGTLWQESVRCGVRMKLRSP
jgi:hypothetical protein